MRIFTLPPAAETPPEPNFYDSMKKIRLRQQLEMYSIGKSEGGGDSPGPAGYWGPFLKRWPRALCNGNAPGRVAPCEQGFCSSQGCRTVA